MNEKKISNLAVTAIILLFCACNGPRYVYSSSPLISPVPGEEGSTSAEMTFSTHNKRSNDFNIDNNKDRAVGFTLSHSPTEKNSFFVNVDLQNESNVFPNIADSMQRVMYNGGFDSSTVKTHRYKIGGGLVHFLGGNNDGSVVLPSMAASFDLHHMNLRETGKLNGGLYQRFFKMYQLSLSLQFNVLFRISSRFNLAYISRVTLVRFFKPKTDYTELEKYNVGFNKAGRTELYPGLIGGYFDYAPFKGIPFSLNFQLFNDFAIWNKLLAKFDPGRTNMKGSGVAMGMKYTIN